MNPDASKPKSTFKQAVLVGLILIVGVALAAVILGAKTATHAGDGHAGHADAAKDEHGHDKDEHAPAAPAKKGPHGGRLFTQDGYGLELTIFETGVEPQFRLYTFKDGKPLDPAQSEVTLAVERLGRKPQIFTFTKEADYLRGSATVDEPHSFAVKIAARHAGQDHSFGFEQVEAQVKMSDEQVKNSGVQLATAGPARIKVMLQLQGEVRLNEDRTVHVVPRLAGLVESVAANAGDRVQRGQVLAVLSSHELASQRSELLATRKRLELARITLQREKKLWEEKISAQQDYLQAGAAVQEAEIAEQSARHKLAVLGAAEAPEGNPTRYEIRAPIDGVITEKKVSVGQVLKDDADIFVVADLSSVWVELTVQAKDLNVVKAGQKALVKAASFPAEANGRVSYVGALVGEQTRAAKARIVLPNPKGLWRPGLPVNVELTADEIQVPLAVRADAVQSLRDWRVVFGRYGDKFEARPLELGRSDGQVVEVLGGLEPGERYAARNSFVIKADIGKAGASHDH
jgi:membrane fusion protein, heavy metal efflux system